MSKRYFWLKLKDDFFEQDEIKIVEAMDNGKDYIMFYLKLVLKSINADGILMFKDAIPYSDRMLATITNTNVDIVKSAVSVFIELGMMEKWDNGTLFMVATSGMIGSESKSAARVRKHRKNNNLPKPKEVKALQCNGVVTKCNTEIDTEKEIDTEIDKKEEGQPTVAELNSKKNIIARLIENGIDEGLADEYWYFRETIRKSRLSNRAVSGLINHCSKNNFPLAEAIKFSIENCYTGFDVSWVNKKGNKNESNTGGNVPHNIRVQQELQNRAQRARDSGVLDNFDGPL